MTPGNLYTILWLDISEENNDDPANAEVVTCVSCGFYAGMKTVSHAGNLTPVVTFRLSEYSDAETQDGWVCIPERNILAVKEQEIPENWPRRRA